mgnify:CR=1 FL=1
MITAHTDVVGSLLRPPYLLDARRDLAASALSDAAFKTLEDQAVNEAVALQEEAGLEVVTDGEMRRLSFQSQLPEAVSGFGDFDLDAFDESPQVARYGAEREGHFGWHSDIGDGRLAARRKLTMVVQLTCPGRYCGGTLEIMPSAHSLKAAPERGTATLFPSFLLHRVTPVSQGERHSLTIWAHGPAFR